MAVVEKIGVIKNLTLGEAPHWDVATKSLYFLDIFEKSIHKYTPGTKSHVETKTGLGYISFIIPINGKEEHFVVNDGKKIMVIKRDEFQKFISVQKVNELDDSKGNRINDAKCDSTGRLWFGTLSIEENYNIEPNMGSIYSADVNGSLKEHDSQITISNGITFNKDNNKMFFIDSHKGTVDEYQFNIENENITNRKTLFTLKKHNIDGLPDGMTIDTEDNLWVAVFQGSCVIQISTEKPEHLLRKINLPAQQITSVAFGGDNLDELYVTSARIKFGSFAEPDGPHDGGLFKITGLGVKGFPMNNYRLQ